MAKKNSILQEAIADAKAVRETALANARLALEEAFTPHLTSMLSAKLKQESEVGPGDGMETDPEDDTFGTVQEDATPDSSEIGGNGVTVDEPAPKMPSKDASDSSDIENDKTLTEDEEPSDDEDSFDVSDITDVGGDATDTGSAPDEGGDDDDLDLESIIRELEAPEDEEGAPQDAPVADAAPAPDAGAAPAADLPDDGSASAEDDDIDLEEILKEMEAESSPADAPAETPDASAELEEVKGELKEYREAVQFLRSKLQEVNLLNAKLLFTNKLFKNYNMNVGQKMQVVETFDRARTVREAKLVFSTLAESFSAKAPSAGAPASNGSKKQITEGVASKAVKSTAPEAPVITEGTELARRFQKLACISK
jgi:hypothetical protein